MADQQKVGDEIAANCELIEVHVPELRPLFNPIDPSPPGERDLDGKAEEFIVSWARSLRRDAPLALHVDVDKPGVRASFRATMRRQQGNEIEDGLTAQQSRILGYELR